MTPPLPCNHQSCNHKIIWSCGNTWPYEPPPEREGCQHWKFKKVCVACKAQIDGEQCIPTKEQWAEFTGKEPPSPAKGPGDPLQQLPPCNQPMNHPKGCRCQKPETAKCDKANQAGHHAVNNCGCLCCIPAIRRAVEEKIKEIRWMPSESVDDQDAIEKKLRELVEMVRQEGKNV